MKKQFYSSEWLIEEAHKDMVPNHTTIKGISGIIRNFYSDFSYDFEQSYLSFNKTVFHYFFVSIISDFITEFSIKSSPSLSFDNFLLSNTHGCNCSNTRFTDTEIGAIRNYCQNPLNSSHFSYEVVNPYLYGAPEYFLHFFNINHIDILKGFPIIFKEYEYAKFTPPLTNQSPSSEPLIQEIFTPITFKINHVKDTLEMYLTLPYSPLRHLDLVHNFIIRGKETQFLKIASIDLDTIRFSTVKNYHQFSISEAVAQTLEKSFPPEKEEIIQDLFQQLLR